MDNEADDVFVSYSSKDAAAVTRFVAELRGQGVRVWQDVSHIGIGAAYNEEIVRALKAAKAVFLMCSADSLASDNVHQELAVYWKHGGRRILPIWLTPPTALPDRIDYFLSSKQYFSVLDRPSTEWMPRVLHTLASFGVQPRSLNDLADAKETKSEPTATPDSLADQIGRFTRNLGRHAGFAARTAINHLLPGSQFLGELAEHMLQIGDDSSASVGNDQLLAVLNQHFAETRRLGEALDVLQNGVSEALHHLASMKSRSPMNGDEVRHAFVDASAEQGAGQKLADLFGTVERLDERAERAIRELKKLRSPAPGATSSANAPVASTAATVATPLALIDSREVALREQAAWTQRLGCGVAWTDDFRTAFRLIPAGRFRMGAHAGDTAASANEHPARIVSIARPFWFATFPLTAESLQAILEAIDPGEKTEAVKLLRDKAFAFSARTAANDPNLPATEISFRDAYLLANWLTQRNHRRYRLPTEAEWEFASRAGATRPWWWDPGQKDREMAVFSASGPQPAFQGRANSWGIVDPVGNVGVWTASEFGKLDAPTINRIAPLTTSTLCVRGGCWQDPLENLRMSRRFSMNATTRKNWLGVRFVVEID